MTLEHRKYDHPRHTRLFELIRQDNVVHDAADRPVKPKAQTQSDIQRFRQLAAQSLMPEAEVSKRH